MPRWQRFESSCKPQSQELPSTPAGQAWATGKTPEESFGLRLPAYRCPPALLPQLRAGWRLPRARETRGKLPPGLSRTLPERISWLADHIPRKPSKYWKKPERSLVSTKSGRRSEWRESLPDDCSDLS